MTYKLFQVIFIQYIFYLLCIQSIYTPIFTLGLIDRLCVTNHGPSLDQNLSLCQNLLFIFMEPVHIQLRTLYPPCTLYKNPVPYTCPAGSLSLEAASCFCSESLSHRDGNQSDRNCVDLSIRSESGFSNRYLIPETIISDRIVSHIRSGPICQEDKHGTSPI